MGLRAFVNWWRNLPPLLILLSVGAIHGGLYLVIVPPWQHYDEPTHFEYAWWVANHGRLPTEGDYDTNMRREVAASMVEHHFFDNLQPPNLLLNKTWIGISQTTDPPLYYLFVAIPLWFLRGADVTMQLHAARVVSFGMFLLILWTCYLLTVEIFPEKKTLQWLIPLGIALIPAFVDLMTAVNNDVGATLAFTLFLWMGTRFIHKPLSFKNILGLGLVVGICVLTKNTIFIAVPMGVLLIFLKFSLSPTWWRYLAWGGTAILCIGTALFLFSRADAAAWYRSRISVQQDQSTQSKLGDGNAVLTIQFSPEEKTALTLSQPLPLETIKTLAGKPYTLGGWLWASTSVEVQLPTLIIDGTANFETATVATTPTFFVVSEIMPAAPSLVSILLDPFETPPDFPVTLFFDNLILVEGKFSAGPPPDFSPGNLTGSWGNEDFYNFVRNSDSETKWYTIKPALLYRFQEQNNIPLYALPALQDLPLTANFYRHTLVNLFESFWGRFGWNHIGLSQEVYQFLAGFSLLGFLASFIALSDFVKTSHNTRFLLFWFAACASLIWIAALARQGLPFWDAQVFTPSARYAYPAIFPTSLAIFVGWQKIPFISKKFSNWGYLAIAILIVLDITSLFVLLDFYHTVQ